MTILNEIEQLKALLSQTTDEQAQAELILALLRKYTSIRSTDSKPYIERLRQLAKKMASVRYEAWVHYYLAKVNYFTGQYDVSASLTQQALPLFEQVGDMEGVLKACSSTGMILELQGNYSGALKNYSSALQISEEINDRDGIASSYNNIGIVHDKQGNCNEALKNYLRALQIREEMGDEPGVAALSSNIGLIHDQQGNYPEALKNYLKALGIFEEIGDQQGIAVLYMHCGGIYKEQGSYPEALKNYFQALRIYQEIGHKKGTANALTNIGNTHRSQGQYSEALKNYSQALQLVVEIGDKRGIAAAHNNVGTIHERQGNYGEAMKNHLKALEIGREMGEKRRIVESYYCIGEVLDKQADYTEAIRNKIYALQMSEELNYKDLVKKSSLSLSNSYKAINDFENALKYHEKYHQLEGEILGEQAQKQLTNLNFQHNMEQKEKEAEISRLRNVELKGALDHLQIEKDRSENLLLNILPSEVAEELKQKGESEARLFEDVTVLFTDFKGFTTVSEQLTPKELVNELHSCFKAFDEIISKYNIEKIKTVGDAYLAASGVPVPNVNHAEELVKAAVEIRDFMLNRRKQLGDKTFEMRVGLHSGKVVAGIVGVKKFAYDIWGDTVNTAARMEQNGEAGKVNISEATYELIKDKFKCEYRGEIEAKNKGRLKMYFVE